MLPGFTSNFTAPALPRLLNGATARTASRAASFGQITNKAANKIASTSAGLAQRRPAPTALISARASTFPTSSPAAFASSSNSPAEAPLSAPESSSTVLIRSSISGCLPSIQRATCTSPIFRISGRIPTTSAAPVASSHATNIAQRTAVGSGARK